MAEFSSAVTSGTRTMLAAGVRKTGGPDAVTLLQLPVPSPQNKQVLIEIHATSVNPIDVKIRSGAVLPFLLKNPKVLGGDAAGVVVRTGPGCKLAVGSKVFGHLETVPPFIKQGTYAEYVTTKEGPLARLPPSVSFEQAAALPTVGLTAWAALKPESIKPGQRVLVHAGAGGVGHIAIQLAKLKGAFVVATGRNAYKSFLEGLGADQVIDYTQSDFDQVLMDNPVDFVVDSVGGDYYARSMSIIKKSGHYGHILSQGYVRHGHGPTVAIAFEVWDAVKGYASHAFGRGPKYTLVAVQPNGPVLAKLADLVETGKLRVNVDKVFPLKEASAAHQYHQDARPLGKVVLKVR